MHAGGTLSPWLIVEGYTIFLNLEDVLHVDGLGIGKDIGGSAIAHLIERDDLWDAGASKLDRMQLLHLQGKAWGSTSGTGFPSRTWDLNTIGWGSSTKGFPILSSKAKDAATGIINVFLAVEVARVARDTVEDKLLNVCTWGRTDLFTHCFMPA